LPRLKDSKIKTLKNNFFETLRLSVRVNGFDFRQSGILGTINKFVQKDLSIRNFFSQIDKFTIRKIGLIYLC